MPEVCGHIVRDALLLVPAADIISRTFITPTLHIGEVPDHKILSSKVSVVADKVVIEAR